jgi:ribosomal protein L21E
MPSRSPSLTLFEASMRAPVSEGGTRSTTPTHALRVGDRVRIERDEARYPSKGTWPQFRGRQGTVVVVGSDEYGVTFGVTRKRPNGSTTGQNITWFRPDELRREEED